MEEMLYDIMLLLLSVFDSHDYFKASATHTLLSFIQCLVVFEFKSLPGLVVVVLKRLSRNNFKWHKLAKACFNILPEREKEYNPIEARKQLQCRG